MQYKTTLSTVDIKDLGIPYIKGILNTFAALNEPETDLFYEYNIEEVDRGDRDMIEAIKNKFSIFNNQSFNLKLIGQGKFKGLLKEWLFENVTLPENQSMRFVDFFFNTLKEITDFKAVYIINDLDLPKFSYDFGVSYEYFVIEADTKLFILYFNFKD